jgi:hypothetical protein
MTTTAVTSVGSLPRIDRARAWLETRDTAEEVLILGASLGAANELARGLAKTRGAAFGWHRLTLARLAANIASPVLNERGLASFIVSGSSDGSADSSRSPIHPASRARSPPSLQSCGLRNCHPKP